MKKLIVIFGILITTFTACSDFIEEENLSSVSAESFYLTPEGYEALINSNYAQLKEIYGGAPWLFCAGTDLYAEGRTKEPDGLSKYTQLNSSSEGVAQLYNTCYKAIQNANMALYYSGITSQTNKISTLVGEVKYLRANAYFLLVQTYGGVALVTDYISSPVLSFNRNSAEEVYTQIIKDLDDALLSVGTGTYNGRVNKRAVQDLLARVYLTRGYESFGSVSDFTKAAALADEVIAGQSLSLTFDQLWRPGNEMNSEVVFSVQYSSASTSTSPTTLGNMQSVFFGPYLGGAEVAGKAPYRSYNLLPTDFALGLYTKEDSRWKGTFMTEIYARYYDFYDKADLSTTLITDFYEPKWFTAQDKIDYLKKPNLAPNLRYHSWGTHSAQVVSLDYATIPVRKFDDPKSPFGILTRVSTRDIILARLGATYLIAAEAYLKTNPATGLTRLNEVRRRAGVGPATLGEFNIDYLLDESARELLGEYHRWFELKRTGKLVERASLHHYLIQASNFNGANGQLKILRPIPQEALDLNQNKSFPQNPAYQ
ncbi:MAG: RagB/SusD family nutrient uptake outer membrane protein [Lutibacter sp.]|nr:RagB/SusD family nutrient uptake outer membrane protein [Lutibacter sp.]